jgi:hypothetical protein
LHLLPRCRWRWVLREQRSRSQKYSVPLTFDELPEERHDRRLVRLHAKRLELHHAMLG